jgi:hypothetical protein
MPTDNGKSLPEDAADRRRSSMGSMKTRGGTAQLPIQGTEHLGNRLSSQATSGIKGTKDPADHVVSLNPSDRLTVLYGHPVVSKIALQALVDRSLSGHPIVYLDGIHMSDAFLIGKLARRRRQQTRKALAMIHVARAFSARQLERLMSQCLADALERYQADTAVISGLLETLSAADLTGNEVTQLADRMIESIRHLVQQGFSLLCPCPSVPPPMASAHRMFALLRSMSDRCIRVYEAQGKIVAEEITIDAMPDSAAPSQLISAGDPPPLPIFPPVRYSSATPP